MKKTVVAVSVGVVAVVILSSTVGQAAPVWNPANGHWYEVRTGVVTWAEAYLSAQTYYNGVRGHLATITSADENTFITSLLGSGCNAAQIGGTDDGSEGVWRWITGEPFVYVNWAAGEPNNEFGGENFLVIYGPVHPETGKWNDSHGEATLGHPSYVVEWEPEDVEPPASGVTPVPGDYDGDGANDLAIYDPNTGNWYIRSLGDVDAPITFAQTWGFPGAIPVPGDYNGDKVSDLAVYDPIGGTWYIRSLGDVEGPITFGQQWGGQGMVPVPGDYNKDGVYDLAVYHEASGNWYIRSLGDVDAPITFGQNWGW